MDGGPVLDALIVVVPFTAPNLGSADDYATISALEERLIEAITKAEVGEFDGHEFGDGDCRILFYGASAEQLASIIIPIVQASSLCHKSYVLRRCEGPAAEEHRFAVQSGEDLGNQKNTLFGEPDLQ